MSCNSYELTGVNNVCFQLEDDSSTNNEAFLRHRRNHDPAASSTGINDSDGLMDENDYFDSQCNSHMETDVSHYRQHRTTSIHRNTTVGGGDSLNRSRSQSLEDRRNWMDTTGRLRW